MHIQHCRLLIILLPFALFYALEGISIYHKRMIEILNHGTFLVVQWLGTSTVGPWV